eukprot:TRINITY_DN10971_c0_g1_i1.p1 TRINITY_DN10971_c0_g1~~TRINITY_DN10971_c0_g1_i1.p1  ORF type:complete len:128 (-),score=5.13 TRINITY_DN10971_c0_g1_i1:12-395(-)
MSHHYDSTHFARWNGPCVYTGSYIASSNIDPVPPFPCEENSECTSENRLCRSHKYVLYCKTLGGITFEIPFGMGECWGWYKDRIYEVTGIHPDRQRIIFAGAQQEDHRRHSGLQWGSSVFFIPKDNN